MVIDIVAIVAVVGSSLVSIIHGIQASKCDWVKCGCIEFTRKMDNKKQEEAFIASPVITGRTAI